MIIFLIRVRGVQCRYMRADRCCHDAVTPVHVARDVHHIATITMFCRIVTPLLAVRPRRHAARRYCRHAY